MTRIADMHANASGGITFICDFSPPRGAAFDDIDAARTLGAHCLSVPYNPGRSVYANSALAAHALQRATGKDVVFTLATRDMNILAAQSLIAGAALLGLENIIVARGDGFSPRDLTLVRSVHDRTPSELIGSIADMNRGIDFRGRSLRSPMDMCIGATIDINRPIDSEVALTRRKVEAGADFFITQPAFAPDPDLRFLEAYEQLHCGAPPVPIFFGVHMAAPGSRTFTPPPESTVDELNAGASSAAMAIRAINDFIAEGITSFYLLPPIFPGGERDYESASRVLDHFAAEML